MLAFFPFLPLIVSQAKPELLPSLISSVEFRLRESKRKEVAIHESGHILLAHLLGFEVSSVLFTPDSISSTLAAVEFKAPSSSASDMARRLGFDSPRGDSEAYSGPAGEASSSTSTGQFFEEGGRGAQQVAEQSVFRNVTAVRSSAPLPEDSSVARLGSKKSWPYRGFSLSDVQSLACISMAGIAAELTYSLRDDMKSSGGSNDVAQLQQIFDQCETPLSDEERERITCQAIMVSITYLKYYSGCFADLVDYLLKGEGVEDGGAATYGLIENCADRLGETSETKVSKKGSGSGSSSSSSSSSSKQQIRIERELKRSTTSFLPPSH